MTRTEANAVARDMERCGYNVTAIRRYHDGADGWAIDFEETATAAQESIYVAVHWQYRKRAAGLDDTPAAGRPPVYGATMTPHTVRLTAEMWQHVIGQGGDYSAGLRLIVARDMEQAKEDA